MNTRNHLLQAVFKISNCCFYLFLNFYLEKTFELKKWKKDSQYLFDGNRIRMQVRKQQKWQLSCHQKKIENLFFKLFRCRMLHWRNIIITLFIIGFQILCFKTTFISQGRNVNSSLQQQRQILSSNESTYNKPSEFVEDWGETQLNRMKSIRRYCKSSKMSGKRSTTYNDEITLVTDTEKRLGFCHVPKVASSAW